MNVGAGTFEAGRRLRRIAAALARDGDGGSAAGGPAPSTNNPIESWNARLRDTPRRHRGPRLTRQLKAICRWRRQHTEHPEADARPAENAITGQQLEDLYRQGMGKEPARHARDVRHPQRGTTPASTGTTPTHASNGSQTTKPPDTFWPVTQRSETEGGSSRNTWWNRVREVHVPQV